jgi:methyl-accepting chemotaxis protein
MDCRATAPMRRTSFRRHSNGARTSRSARRPSSRAGGDTPVERTVTQRASTKRARHCRTEEVTAAIDQIDASSSELAHGLEDLAEETQRASESTDDFSASIQQIDAQSAEAVEMAETGVDDAASLTEEMTASTQQSSAGIDKQATAMDEVARSAQRLSQMSKATHERVDVFKTAADQNANPEEKV